MSEQFIYLLKVTMAIGLVSIPYLLFMRNDPNLVVKRIYLVTGILISWIFPFITIKKPLLAARMDPVFLIDPGIPTTATIEVTSNQAASASPLPILEIVYIAGILAFIIINLISLTKLRRKGVRDHNKKNLFLTNSEKVFTVYPNIFLPKKYTEPDEFKPILIHERAHIRQLHIADLLISELSLALTWFNPFSWLISRMIKENHEHLADRYVLRQGVNHAHYKALLLNHALGGDVFRLGHRFNHSLTKKRFIMMKKMKAPKSGNLKYIFIVPAILACTLVLTAANQQLKKVSGKVYLENTATPAKGAAVIIAGTTMGTVAGPDGSFTLETEGNPDIAISFVGYRTVRKPASELSDRPVILIPTAYTINYDEPHRIEQEKEIIIRKGKQDHPNKKVFITGEEIDWTEYADSAGSRITREIEVIKKDDGTPPMVFINGRQVHPGDSLYAEEIEELDRLNEKLDIQHDKLDMDLENIDIQHDKLDRLHEELDLHDKKLDMNDEKVKQYKEQLDQHKKELDRLNEINGSGAEEDHEEVQVIKIRKYDPTGEEESQTMKNVPGAKQIIIETNKADEDSGISEKQEQEEKIFIMRKHGKELHESRILAEEETFRVVESIPSFPGGKSALRDFINNNLSYPKKAMKNQSAGEVMVGFTVSPDGKPADIHVTQSSNEIFNDAALQVIKKMPPWNPAMQQGEPVRAKVIVPVRFYPAQE
jgi:TonB family protein